jgi:hypothetical protein
MVVWIIQRYMLIIIYKCSSYREKNKKSLYGVDKYESFDFVKKQI